MTPNFISSVSEKRRKDQPICPVCQEHFNVGQRVPKLFTCAHSVCDMCVEKLLEYRKFNAPYQQVALTCPVCRNTTVWHPDIGLRTNFGLLEAVQGLQKSEQKHINIVECSGCKRHFDEKDVHICVDCAYKKENIYFVSIDNIPADYNLEKVGICSTCVIDSHIGFAHRRISFQNIRVQHQLVVNYKEVTEQMDNYVKTTNSSLSVLAQTTDIMKTSLQETKQSVEKFMKCGSSEEQEVKLLKIFKEIKIVSSFLKKIEASCSDINEALKNDLQKLNSDPSMDVVELEGRESQNQSENLYHIQENTPLFHGMDRNTRHDFIW